MLWRTQLWNQLSHPRGPNDCFFDRYGKDASRNEFGLTLLSRQDVGCGMVVGGFARFQVLNLEFQGLKFQRITAF